jgi:hypothetical protein
MAMEAPGQLYPLYGLPADPPPRVKRVWVLLGLAALLGVALGILGFVAGQLWSASRSAAPFLAVGGRVGDGGDLIGRLRGAAAHRGVFLADRGLLDDDLGRLRGPLLGLPNLTELYLDDNPIGDEGLAHLRDLDRLGGLRNLSLARTRITDAGLVHLRGLRQLRWLDLGGTGVTTQGVRGLNRALPETRIIHDDRDG